MSKEKKIYGVLAEFEHAEELIEAAKKTRDAGYEKIDAYTPFPLEGIDEAIGFKKNGIALIVLIAAICGLIGGYFMQYYASVIHFPLNVGGRPFNSWPSFMPITFECTILAAAFGAVFGMLALNGLPTPYHPLFNVPEFELASRSRFFLCIKARDKKFDLYEARKFLKGLNPHGVYDVED